MSGSELARKRLATLQREYEQLTKWYSRYTGQKRRNIERRLKAVGAEIKQREAAQGKDGRAGVK